VAIAPGRSSDHGTWTSTVHAFLRHLETVGFAGAPRVLGMDDIGREVLSFVDGDVLADPVWQPGRPTPWPGWAQSEESLVESARLLRRLHEASTSFVPPDHAVWRQHTCPALGRHEIVCHGDVGPARLRRPTRRVGTPTTAIVLWPRLRGTLVNIALVSLANPLVRTAARLRPPAR
jgi:hypothetical protein